MHESFLYYIWQFQYFDKANLKTCDGELIEVINPGLLNNHAGPDFSNAQVKIDGIDWIGNVEIHTKASDWFEHKHNEDQAYENVILHVVWQNDKPAFRSDKTMLPTLELNARISASLLKEYKLLIHNPFSIPCRRSFRQVDPVIKLSMLDRTLMQRLEMKADKVIDLLKHNNNDWEETAFQTLAGNFGFKVNNDPFARLGRSISYRVLLKHADKLVQLEALLFGQAGFLDTPIGDDYYKVLQREYKMLSQKYNLASQKLARAQWRFLRLRPANFPTVRLAQFSALIHLKKNVFSRILETESCVGLKGLFSLQQSEYWQHHYRFNKKSSSLVTALGEASIDNIIINSAVPLMVAYGRYNDLQALVDRAVGILQAIPAENNSIVKTWRQTGYAAGSAFDSQALIELYNHYCQHRNCLTCAIGVSLLKPKS